jgi:enoyl-CoA hydratase/carnithine racemase
MSDAVTVHIERGVADVRLNRPDKLNALNGAVIAGLSEAGDRLAQDPSVRAVVLSGEGRAFCAGLDFSGFQAMAGEGDGQNVGGIGQIEEGRITHGGQQAAHTWSEVPVPVIAAIQGPCLGGGLQITLGRLVGPDVAKELAWTGRMVSGEEAVRLGLATRTSDSPLDDALALAADIAGRSPHAIRGIKHLVDLSGTVSLAEQYAEERRVIGSLIGTPNQVEAVTAFFEKRDPAFADPD